MNRSSKTRNYYLHALCARSVAFIALLVYALCCPERFSADLTATGFRLTPLTIVWLLLMLSMILRFFPSRQESIGCQKEFAHRFRPTGAQVSPQEIRQADRGALWVLLSWLALNGLFYVGYALKIVDLRFMVCLAGFYSICDIICILFFCPFQAWMMRNRCCTTCRIFNWDYIMICTPLMVLTGPLARIACLLSILLLLRWELTYRRNSERFFESANDALRCANCQEHLCKYKRALSRKVKQLH